MANEVWSLIIKLPTNPKIKQEVHTLQNIKQLLSSSKHKMLYTLQLIESLLEQDVNQNDWLVQFLQQQGFDCLYETLMSNRWIIDDYFNKTILYFLFKMLRTFIMAA